MGRAAGLATEVTEITEEEKGKKKGHERKGPAPAQAIGG